MVPAAQNSWCPLFFPELLVFLVLPSPFATGHSLFAYVIMLSRLPGDQNLQAGKVIQVHSAMGASPRGGHAADDGLARDGRIQDAANLLLTYLVNMLRS